MRKAVKFFLNGNEITKVKQDGETVMDSNRPRQQSDVRQTCLRRRRVGRRLPIVVVAVVVVAAAAGRLPADGLVLLGQDVDLLSALGVRRRHEVAAVVDEVGPGDPPFEHLRRELVRVAQVWKTRKFFFNSEIIKNLRQMFGKQIKLKTWTS